MMKKAKLSQREPIALRTKALKDGRLSLYLDFYEPERGRNHAHRYEFLKLYLLPDTRANKDTNNATMQSAKAIQAQRLIDRANGKAGTTSQSKMMLLDYMRIFIDKKRKAGISNARIVLYNTTYNIISTLKLDRKLISIDTEYLKNFIVILTHSQDKRESKNQTNIKASTAHEYYSILVSVLNQAVRDELIPTNPAQRLQSEDKRLLRNDSAPREFLTTEELQRLNATHIRNKDLKRAFMFCCFTGLRWSDVSKLQWADIYTDNGKRFVRVEMTKTKREIIVPLSTTALSFLPEESKGIIYPNLPKTSSGRCSYIKRWAEKAGIDKNICFHVSRHTFATSLLTQGADLYTTSKLLGHTDIKTTQIYAEIVDKKKTDAVNLLDNIKL